jgi:hypothetical protein
METDREGQQEAVDRVDNCDRQRRRDGVSPELASPTSRSSKTLRESPMEFGWFPAEAKARFERSAMPAPVFGESTLATDGNQRVRFGLTAGCQ